MDCPSFVCATAESRRLTRVESTLDQANLAAKLRLVQRRALAGVGALCSFCIWGCQTYSAELQRGQGYYEQYQYEVALSLWRHLELEMDALDEREQVRYCYLRGMTDYRLGYSNHAVYWLSLAQTASRGRPGALQAAEAERLNDALDNLLGHPAARRPGAPTGGDQQGPRPTRTGEPPSTDLRCKWSSECQAGYMCWQGSCAAVE